MSVSEFCDADQAGAHEAFQRWRAENPAAYFLNCRMSGRWMIHRVGCKHPGNTDWQAEEFGSSLTRFRKVCSDDSGELRAWAHAQGEVEVIGCSDCKP